MLVPEVALCGICAMGIEYSSTRRLILCAVSEGSRKEYKKLKRLAFIVYVCDNITRWALFGVVSVCVCVGAIIHDMCEYMVSLCAWRGLQCCYWRVKVRPRPLNNRLFLQRYVINFTSDQRHHLCTSSCQSMYKLCLKSLRKVKIGIAKLWDKCGLLIFKFVWFKMKLLMDVWRNVQVKWQFRM